MGAQPVQLRQGRAGQPVSASPSRARPDQRRAPRHPEGRGLRRPALPRPADRRFPAAGHPAAQDHGPASHPGGAHVGGSGSRGPRPEHGLPARRSRARGAAAHGRAGTGGSRLRARTRSGRLRDFRRDPRSARSAQSGATVTNPLVTVIVAVHNGQRFLRPALESLYAQDYEPFEVVLIDDGSTDGSSEIARSFPSIRYVYQENRGQAAARNAGLLAARGEFLAYLDADDLIPPPKLRRQAEYLIANPDVGCVLGRQEIMLEPGVDPPDWLTRDSVFGDLDGIAFVSAMIRTELL